MRRSTKDIQGLALGSRKARSSLVGRRTKARIFGCTVCLDAVRPSLAPQSSKLFNNGAQIGTIAYFYFNFNESPRCEEMLRSILTQLSSLSADMSKPLESLYSSCQKGLQQPRSDSLLQTLHETVETASEVFMILDTLDECEERHELLDSILKIGAWDCKKLHLLLTSRKERDIDDWLKDLIDDENTIPIQTVLVNSDICAYIRDRLRTDRKLKRWQKDRKLQQEIEATLMKKAHGMYDVLYYNLKLCSLSG